MDNEKEYQRIIDAYNSNKIQDKNWFTIVMLILFFPYGLYLMWNNYKFNLLTRVIITLIFILMVIGLIKPSEDKKIDNQINNRVSDDYSMPSDENVVTEQRLEKKADKKNDYTLLENSTLSDKIYSLEYGELGEFGKEEIFDGDKYINYYLPSGKYRILHKESRINKIFIVSDSTHMNSEGRVEDDFSSSIDLNKTDLFELKDGEHIELTLTTKIELKRMED